MASDKTTHCGQCQRPVLAGDPAYVFRGQTYHDWCNDYLSEVAAQTESEMREEWNV